MVVAVVVVVVVMEVVGRGVLVVVAVVVAVIVATIAIGGREKASGKVDVVDDEVNSSVEVKALVVGLVVVAGGEVLVSVGAEPLVGIEVMVV